MHIHHRRQVLLTTLKLTDAFGMCIMFFAAAIFARTGESSARLQTAVPLWYVMVLLGFIFLWLTCFSMFDLYHSRRVSSQQNELFDVIKAGTCGSLLIFAIAYCLPWRFSRWSFLLAFWVGATIFAVVSRAVMRWTAALLRRRGHNLRHVLIFGTNPLALKLAALLTARPELGYRMAGFVDSERDGIAAFSGQGFETVATLDSYPHYLRRSIVDEAWICLPVHSQYSTVVKIGQSCLEQGIITRVATDLFDTLPGRDSRIDSFEGESIITLGKGLEGVGGVAKIVFDRVLALLCLVALSPALILAAIAVRLSSPGPILFRQLRLGLHKRPFWMLKFRSMVANAEQMESSVAALNEASGPVFKIRKDPRVTPIGRFLRQFSIDELPQLINVLKGEMSLVGPRPLAPREYDRFSEDRHLRRCSVRPGISGLWQVSGRSTVQFDRWMILDMQYIDEWSFWLDMKILFRTIFVVIRREGAW
jgi:exopolysaccharide biosynthesis polyprenyl glycosylphosphotransferase